MTCEGRAPAIVKGKSLQDSCVTSHGWLGDGSTHEMAGDGEGGRQGRGC